MLMSSILNPSLPPLTRVARSTLLLQQPLSHHLAWILVSSLLKPTLPISSSTCPLYVFFGRPCFCGSFTLNSSTLLRMWSLFLLKACPYHCTPFVFASCSTDSSSPSIPIKSYHILLSPLLSWSSSKLPFHFSPNTISHSHTTLRITHNSKMIDR